MEGPNITILFNIVMSNFPLNISMIIVGSSSPGDQFNMEELMLQLSDAPPGPYHDDHEALMKKTWQWPRIASILCIQLSGRLINARSVSTNYIQEFTIGDDTKSVVPCANPISSDSSTERGTSERGDKARRQLQQSLWWNWQ